MSVAARVAQEMSVKLGNEVSPGIATARLKLAKKPTITHGVFVVCMLKMTWLATIAKERV